eukprot:7251799-Alexandrium_andersonii.AAC.1
MSRNSSMLVLCGSMRPLRQWRSYRSRSSAISAMFKGLAALEDETAAEFQESGGCKCTPANVPNRFKQ